MTKTSERENNIFVAGTYTFLSIPITLMGERLSSKLKGIASVAQ